MEASGSNTLYQYLKYHPNPAPNLEFEDIVFDDQNIETKLQWKME